MSDSTIARRKACAQPNVARPPSALSPALVRDELLTRALRADAQRLWLASAAHVALSWRRVDGSMRAEGPTLADVDELARHAGAVEPAVRDAALSLLRSIATG
jgi:hypothetical protein